jgi:hypothetical protein
MAKKCNRINRADGTLMIPQLHKARSYSAYFVSFSAHPTYMQYKLSV